MNAQTSVEYLSEYVLVEVCQLQFASGELHQTPDEPCRNPIVLDPAVHVLMRYLDVPGQHYNTTGPGLTRRARRQQQVVQRAEGFVTADIRVFNYPMGLIWRFCT